VLAREALPAPLNQLLVLGFIILIICVGLGVHFWPGDTKKDTPLQRIIEEKHGSLHAVGPDTLVVDCVRKMNNERIGAVLVLDNGRLLGLFTERNALNNVLDAGLDPKTTKVSAVMTRDPYTIKPSVTVAEAMRIITERRVRHLPVARDDEVIAMVSSGDLTHWLVQDKIGDIQQLIEAANGTRSDL
jgi:signal-transduction protein with cAMP-binding, CBS, and nucleotidyltransferase domain